MAFRRRRRESWPRLQVARFDPRLPDSRHNSKRRSGSAHRRPCTERARMRTKRIWWSLRLALLTRHRDATPPASVIAHLLHPASARARADGFDGEFHIALSGLLEGQRGFDPLPLGE